MAGMMKHRLAATIALLSLSAALSACSLSKQEDKADAKLVSEEVDAAAGPVANAEFSVERVPVTSASLPPAPFFTAPEGLVSVLGDKDKLVNFGQQWFIGGEKPVRLEGKIYKELYPLDADRKYTEIEFRRNYENAITALGGVKINTAQWTPEMVAVSGGEAAVEKANYGQPLIPDYTHDDYLIRTADKEYWISVSAGSIPLHGSVVVLEKQGMKQSVGFLDASAMKKAIDATGHVALQVNFDVDKSTIRPDAQPTVQEIFKLLTGDPSLKLSIEGHTDSTGDAAHNRDLSTARARSVLGALVGLGIDASRLKSRGFGPDKPVADNATDAGRAKNRRVELVKI